MYIIPICHCADDGRDRDAKEIPTRHEIETTGADLQVPEHAVRTKYGRKILSIKLVLENQFGEVETLQKMRVIILVE